MMMRTLALGCVVAAGCGNGTGNDVPGDDAPDAKQFLDAPLHDGPVSGAKPTIFTIVLENHDYAEIVGSANAPYLNSLIAQGGLATSYKDTIHPSLGNYLYMISGANQYPGVIDIGPKQTPFFPANKPHLGTQMTTANIAWRAYQESMGTPCNLDTAGKYAPKHNPFIYFTDFQTSPDCAQKDVDYTAFAADLASNAYRFMWITPNLDSDGHDPTADPVTGLKNSDAWMATEVPKILASPGWLAGGVLFITWDEAENRSASGPDLIPMIVLSPRLKQAGMKSAVAYDHGSYLATVETLLGLPRLATVTGAATMMEFLNP